MNTHLLKADCHSLPRMRTIICFTIPQALFAFIAFVRLVQLPVYLFRSLRFHYCTWNALKRGILSVIFCDFALEWQENAAERQELAEIMKAMAAWLCDALASWKMHDNAENAQTIFQKLPIESAQIQTPARFSRSKSPRIAEVGYLFKIKLWNLYYDVLNKISYVFLVDLGSEGLAESENFMATWKSIDRM